MQCQMQTLQPYTHQAQHPLPLLPVLQLQSSVQEGLSAARPTARQSVVVAANILWKECLLRARPAQRGHMEQATPLCAQTAQAVGIAHLEPVPVRSVQQGRSLQTRGRLQIAHLLHFHGCSRIHPMENITPSSQHLQAVNFTDQQVKQHSWCIFLPILFPLPSRRISSLSHWPRLPVLERAAALPQTSHTLTFAVQTAHG